MACLVAVAGFLEDVGFGVVAGAAGEGVAVVVACLVAFASFSGQGVGTEIVGGDKDAIWRSDIVNWLFSPQKNVMNLLLCTARTTGYCRERHSSGTSNKMSQGREGKDGVGGKEEGEAAMDLYLGR